MERNFSDPRTLRQMNEDFIRLQSIRAELVKVFEAGSTVDPKTLKSSSSEIRKRATRLRTMLSLTEVRSEVDITRERNATILSINKRAFDLCLEVSRFTGNPLFKGKVIVIAHARDASRSLDAVIAIAEALQRESSQLIH
jgi:hypothetical protein